MKVEQPYLDQISMGSLKAFHSLDVHKKLLVQPVAIPNLDHTGCSSTLQTNEAPLVCPDGTVVRALCACNILND